MSLTARGSLIRLFVAQILLIHLISVCFGDDYFGTLGPQPVSCGYNMLCVPKHECIDIRDSSVIVPPTWLCRAGTFCCLTNPHLDNDDYVEHQSPPSIADGCGLRNEKGVDRKVKGLLNDSEFGEFPWALALLSNDRSEKLYGGASLIHPKIALTAAHVIYDKPNDGIKVRAGEWKIQERNELLPHQDRMVSQKIIHENFSIRSLRYDIALLFLQSSFELSLHINTICLPPTNLRLDDVSCFATGWGDIASTRTRPNVLKKVSLKVVEHRNCQRIMRGTILSGFFMLHASFICAGGIKNEDTCIGDGGSPLVCPIPGKEGRYYEVGIVSWGLKDVCGGEGIPGVYCGVSSLRSWVDQKITARGFDPSWYSAV